MRLDLTWLRQAYASGLSPAAMVASVYDHIDEVGSRPVWISLVERETALERARELENSDRSSLPLYGVPFGVKDNIDVFGLPTTAGCPAFSYWPEKSAVVVDKLLAAGAIVIGKTNLDQFATGLVGTRSPYGICRSVFNDQYISGGSSSGSAVAVANGSVSFALGTDTAGSGRVPAAFNNIVGLKPSRGLISTRGVVPACRTLDCVSVFALNSSDAAAVLDITTGYVESDPFSRKIQPSAPWLNSTIRFGIPQPDQWQFFGDTAAMDLYRNAIVTLVDLGAEAFEIDFQPFLDTALLLYNGPWIAERLAAIGNFFDTNETDIDLTVRGIIGGAKNKSAVEAFTGQYQLLACSRAADAAWKSVDILLLPTTGTTYKVTEVLADPLTLNSNLGWYTNFINLLDLAAVAIPASFRPNGLPFGVTLVGRAGTDYALLTLGDRLHRAFKTNLGATQVSIDQTEPMAVPLAPPGCTSIAVVGAHLSGQPLNHQLTTRGARLSLRCKSSPNYRLYALPNTTPKKPGLVHDPSFLGPGIELEVWSMPTIELGSFVAEIPPPLGIGTVELDTGKVVKGFICEPSALEGALEITQFCGWRNYLMG